MAPFCRRPPFVRTRFVLTLLTLALPAALNAAAQAPAKPAPNVLLITIDTLRADHLGCYGYKQIKTPNIDALAAEGTRFDRAFAVVPVTLPSHASILTGTYPMLSGMHDFSGNKLSPLQPTMASVLKQNGYQTGAVIAAAVLDSRFGLNQGFDFYYDHFEFSRLDEANLADYDAREENAITAIFGAPTRAATERSSNATHTTAVGIGADVEDCPGAFGRFQ